MRGGGAGLSFVCLFTLILNEKGSVMRGRVGRGGDKRGSLPRWKTVPSHSKVQINQRKHDNLFVNKLVYAQNALQIEE